MLRTMKVSELPAASRRGGMGDKYDDVLLVMTETRAACVPIGTVDPRIFRSRLYSFMKYHGIRVKTRVDADHETLYVWLQKKGKR